MANVTKNKEVVKLYSELKPHLKKLFHATVLALPPIMILIILIYLLIPKDSWISINAIPDNFALYESKEIVYWANTSNLKFANNATVSLSEDCLIYLTDDEGQMLCEPNQYAYIKLENLTPLPKNLDNSVESFSMDFNEQVIIESIPVPYENLFPAANILFENTRIIYEDSTDARFVENRENTFAVLKDNDSRDGSIEEYFYSNISVSEGTQVIISGTYQLFGYDGELIIDSEDYPQLMIEIASDTVLSAHYEGVVSEIEWDKDLLYIAGFPKRFGVMSRGSEDRLIYTYLDSQVEYIIRSSSVSADASNKACFNAAFTLADGTADYSISGSAQKVFLANKLLEYNPRIFIAENSSALIISIFTAIVGVFVTLTKDVAKKKEEDS